MMITVKVAMNLKGFQFWAGAKDFAAKLTDDECEILEEIIDDSFPDGIDETTLNDMFWFEQDEIAEILGTTVEEIEARE